LVNSLGNILIGNGTGNGITTGGTNTFIGNGAGRDTTEGLQNTFIANYIN